MARTNSNDPAKPVVAEDVLPTAAPAPEPAKVNPVVVDGDQSLVSTDAATAAAASGTATSLDTDAGSVAAHADAPSAAAEDTGEVTIYPLRSYLDGKEVRRAGGKGYKSPKHDAVSLVAAGLATDQKPKA